MDLSSKSAALTSPGCHIAPQSIRSRSEDGSVAFCRGERNSWSNIDRFTVMPPSDCSSESNRNIQGSPLMQTISLRVARHDSISRRQENPLMKQLQEIAIILLPTRTVSVVVINGYDSCNVLMVNSECILFASTCPFHPRLSRQSSFPRRHDNSNL